MKQDPEKDTSELEKEDEPKNIENEKWIGVGLIFGIVFGAMMDNVGLGIAIGLPIGVAIGMRKSKSK